MYFGESQYPINIVPSVLPPEAVLEVIKMSARFDTYRNVFMEIFYNDQGQCAACCNHPVEEGVLESPFFNTPREAFDSLKATLDRLYYDLK